MTTLVRIVAWCAAAALTMAGSAALALWIAPTARVDLAGDPPAGVLTGFYGAERAPDGLTYAWTRPDFGVTLPGLDRSRAAAVTLRYRAARPDGATPAITISVDGIVVGRERLAADFVERRIELPVRVGRAPTHVTISVAPAYVPDGDPRSLGALVDWVAVERTPSATGALSRRGWVALLPVFLLVAAWTAARVPNRILAPGVLGLAGLSAWIVSTGLGNFVTWPVAGQATAALAAGALAWGLTRHVPTTRVLAVVTSAAVAVKVLILLHPSAPIGDAMFHAHRLQTVLAGNWYFTSITPGNYQFPYAPGLYLLSSLFAGLTETAADKVILLRLVTTAVDAVAASAIGLWLWRWRGEAGLAVIGVAAYHLLPLSFEVLWVGNLTNMFAQSLALVAVVLATRDRLSAGWMVCLMALSLAAMLSHTSTFVLLTAHLCAAGLWLIVRPPQESPRAGIRLLAATTTAAVLAVVIYYAHFTDVYTTALARAGEETGRAASSAGFRTPAERLFDVPRLLGLYYTWPGVILAAAGAVSLWRSRRASRISATVAATGAIVLTAFLGLGIVTPLDFRHYLAALPLLAVAVAAGAWHGWTAGGQARLAVAGAGLWLAIAGLTRALAVVLGT